MKRTICVSSLLILAITVSARGADPAPSPQPDKAAEPSAKAEPMVTEPVIPRRELKFERSDEEFSRPFTVLNMPDPKLLECRYVAIFRTTAFSWRALPVGHRDFGDGRLFHTYSVAFLPDSKRRQELQLFPSLARYTPKDRLPPDDVLSVLTTQGASLLSLREESTRDLDDPRRPVHYCAFEVLAPTPERAEQLVEGILALYDYGLSVRMQQEYLKLRQAAEKTLPELREAIPKKQDELALAERQLEALKDFEDIDKESIVNFRAQLRLIAVERAGIEARIDACNKIVAKLEVVRHAQRIEQVETVKITTEIELVGLVAKQNAIEKIVEAGERRIELIDQVAELRGQLGIAKDHLSRTEGRIGDYEKARKHYEPFEIQDNKVVIHPVKWTAPGSYDGAPEE